MKKISFNDGWSYCRVGEDNYKQITLPHDAMLYEERNEDSAGEVNTGWFEGYDYFYKKTFLRPEEAKVFIEFEGIYRMPRIYVNDERVPARPYGYLPVWIDISDKLKEGENCIEVITQNADQPNSRWYTGSGIYRPVWLHVAPKEHILPESVRITTLEINPVKVKIEAETTTCKWTADILDGENIIASLSDENSEMTLDNIRLWSLDDPYLYTVRVRCGDDEEIINYGFRKIECDSKRGFLLNGKRVVLNGACIHHDNGLLGARAEKFAEERKVAILKKNGYNAIRSSHNPCSKALLDACDKQGVLVMDEYVDMWYIHKLKYDYAKYFEEWWRTDVKDMISRDYNHPSVVMYSMGNEVSETAQKKGIQLSKDMTEYCHSLDNTRPVTCGINIFFNFLSSIGFGVYSDKKAEESAKTAKDGKKKAVGSEFFNNMAGTFGSLPMKYGALLHGSDVKTRDAFARFDVAGYNYGVKRCRKDVKKYPDRVIVGSEVFVEDIYEYSELAKELKGVIGSFVWTGMDYIGEVQLGAIEYREYAPKFDKGVGWLTASCGSIDITGKPTAEMAYTRVCYGLENIAIGVLPMTKGDKAHSTSAWRMTSAKQSWSWNGMDGEKTAVEVYTRAPYAALYLNGELLGKKKKPKNDCKVKFPVRYKKGELKALGLDSEGNQLYHAILTTAKEKTVLSIIPEKDSYTKEDLIYVRLAFTDINGEVKMCERADISLNIKGGELLGFGSACPYNERGYITDISDTYYGEALAIIRPTSNEVEITAESEIANNRLLINIS